MPVMHFMTRGKVSLEGLPAIKDSSVGATEQAWVDALQMGCLFHALVTVLIKKLPVRDWQRNWAGPTAVCPKPPVTSFEKSQDSLT